MKLKCILYAEDDESDVALMEFAFQEAKVPLPLQTVSDGEEAIKYLTGTGKYADRAQYPMPALLLLDLKMPRVNGFEVLTWLRQQQAEPGGLPVIVFSASSQQCDIDKAFTLGANSYVTKPATLEDREQFCAAMQDYWLKFDQPTLMKAA